MSGSSKLFKVSILKIFSVIEWGNMQEGWWLTIQRIVALVGLVVMAPVIGVMAWLIKREDGGPVFFKQERWGKGRKSFVIWKLRTMKVGAEQEKEKLLELNEVDGPVFKIRNDPRFTRVGKWLSKVGLDELPQLWNVVWGEMALVGPRPLPVKEAKRVPKKYWRRYEVLPGMTSWWVVRGSHYQLSFKEWMESDLEYVEKGNWWEDVKILVGTVRMVFR